jgi:hypothetical protein
MVIGAVYANLFADRTRAMVFDGAFGHSASFVVQCVDSEERRN